MAEDDLDKWLGAMAFTDLLELDEKYRRGLLAINPFLDGCPPLSDGILNAHGLLLTECEPLIVEKKLASGFTMRQRPRISFFLDQGPTAARLFEKLESRNDVQVFRKKWHEDRAWERVTTVEGRTSPREGWKPIENLVYVDKPDLDWCHDVMEKADPWVAGVIGLSWEDNIDLLALLADVLEGRTWSTIQYQIIGSDGKTFGISKWLC